MTVKMYDLRDGYVPPHLRPPEPTPEPVPALGFPTWAGKRATGRSAKYPFATMPVNGTFRVEPGLNQPKWRSFRTYCSNKGTELGKRFLCHRYEDGTFEVWREK